MPLILPANTLSADAYDVANSCRFNTGDSPYMYKTVVSPTSATISTVSFWMKAIGVTDKGIFAARTDTNNRHSIYWEGAGNARLELWGKRSGSVTVEMHLTRAFRDSSAWVHHVIGIDTTQATAGNRVKWYVNGVQQSVFTTETQATEDSSLEWSVADATIAVGAYAAVGGFSDYFDGYLAEFVFIDGTQYAASDFGEFDSDSPSIWKPKDPSGLTFGNNGFYLDFEASDNLGNDANGGTDLTESGLAAADQATDTPTNNFCVINPSAGDNDENTLSEGNCKIVSTATGSSMGGTFGLSAGKWYWEAKLTASNTQQIGIMDVDKLFTRLDRTPGAAGSNGFIYLTTGNVYNNDSQLLTGLTSSTTDDIISVALDITNLKIYWYKNDSLLNSGGTDITTGLTWFPITGAGGGSDRINQECNFGGCSAFDVGSANQDENGYGNVEYAVPSGYLAICSKNLGSDGG